MEKTTLGVKVLEDAPDTLLGRIKEKEITECFKRFNEQLGILFFDS